MDALPSSRFWVLDEVMLLSDFESVVVIERPTENPGHIDARSLVEEHYVRATECIEGI